jgi:transcriptional regulator
MMYLPESFTKRDPRELCAFIAAHPFAAVISAFADGLEVAQVPLLVRHDPAGMRLVGHVARGNRMWQARDVLVVFSGPHAYISAAWYGAPDTVPTWNYQTVQAHGTLQVVAQEERCRAILDELAQAFDGERARIWQQGLSQEAFTRLRAGIVFIEIAVTSLVGKWKLSQNHSPARRALVIEQLRASGRCEDRALAEAMAGEPAR